MESDGYTYEDARVTLTFADGSTAEQIIHVPFRPDGSGFLDATNRLGRNGAPMKLTEQVLDFVSLALTQYKPGHTIDRGGPDID